MRRRVRPRGTTGRSFSATIAVGTSSSARAAREEDEGLEDVARHQALDHRVVARVVDARALVLGDPRNNFV